MQKTINTKEKIQKKPTDAKTEPKNIIKMRQNLILFINKLLRANGGCLDCKRR